MSDDTFKINGCIWAHLPIIGNLPAATLFRLKLIIVVRLRLWHLWRLSASEDRGYTPRRLRWP